MDESKKILNSTKSRLNTFKEKIYTAINGASEQTNDETSEESQTASSPKNESENNEKKETEQTKTPRPAGKEYSTFGELSLLFFLAILDTIASLVFIAAIVIAIKPALLKGNVNTDTYEFSSVMKQIGNIFLRIEFTKGNL